MPKKYQSKIPLVRSMAKLMKGEKFDGDKLRAFQRTNLSMEEEEIENQEDGEEEE